MAVIAVQTDSAPVIEHQTIVNAFHSHFYQRHNRRRQEHLASLGLDLTRCSVLEVGAAIGDHTDFFLDRGCAVMSTEARPESVELLRARFPEADYPNVRVRLLDLDHPDAAFTERFKIVYCYGTLYHLGRPAEAIEYMAGHCDDLLLMETRVSFGEGEAVNPCEESPINPVQSVWGTGCRPTREWVYRQLCRHFAYVYMPRTQPSHEEFPTDWTTPPPPDLRIRSIFVASRRPLDSDQLVQGVLMCQTW